jgi:hypothetical protein
MTFVRPICNCPDATQKQNKNLFASSQTLTFDRNWQSRTSSGGTTIDFPGIRQRGGYCIHELAVLRITDTQKEAFPSGIPYKPKINSLLPRRRQSQRFDSDGLSIASVEDTI